LEKKRLHYRSGAGEAFRVRKRKEGAAVSEEFGPNFITVTDEDGNDIELELLDVLEHKGQTYMAFFPAVPEEEADEDSDDYGMVILKSIQENGEELLSTLDSEEELTEVYDLFMELLFQDEDEE
jgi:hypothetical protein